MRVTLKDNTIDLTVVIPTLNEGPNLAQLLPQLSAALREMLITSEILVVDGNSPDDTREICAREGAALLCADIDAGSADAVAAEIAVSTTSTPASMSPATRSSVSAVVTSDQWITWQAWLSRLFVDADIQVFSDYDEAQAWALN